MDNWKKHILQEDASIQDVLVRLNKLAADAIVFICDEQETLLGALTDGDVRRGLIHGATTDAKATSIMNTSPKFLENDANDVVKLSEYRKQNLKVVPIVNKSKQIVNIVNFAKQKSFLPIEAIIMAGGKGMRLRPLTEKTPKPLLQVGNKPIIEYALDAMHYNGIGNITISVNYLGKQIEEYISKHPKHSNVHILQEEEMLGTIGAITLLNDIKKETVLLSNSDLLSTVDFEAFYNEFKNQNADLMVLSVPYKVEVPYAVLHEKNGQVSDLFEKPTYTYYSNGGMYLFKKELIDHIPKNAFYNAPDFIELLIQKGLKVCTFKHNGYWLDIGKPADFEKAKEDIKRLRLEWM